MGLAASQARLLFITNRQNDVSAKLQRLSNTNMILARDEEDVSTKYNRMLAHKEYALGNGNALTYENLMGTTAANNGSLYLLQNANTAAVILSSDIASKLGLDGSGKDFNTRYPDNENGKIKFVSKMSGLTQEEINMYGGVNRTNTNNSGGQAGTATLSDILGSSDRNSSIEKYGDSRTGAKYTYYLNKNGKDGVNNITNSFNQVSKNDDGTVTVTKFDSMGNYSYGDHGAQKNDVLSKEKVSLGYLYSVADKQDGMIFLGGYNDKRSDSDNSSAGPAATQIQNAVENLKEFSDGMADALLNNLLKADSSLNASQVKSVIASENQSLLNSYEKNLHWQSSYWQKYGQDNNIEDTDEGAVFYMFNNAYKETADKGSEGILAMYGNDKGSSDKWLFSVNAGTYVKKLVDAVLNKLTGGKCYSESVSYTEQKSIDKDLPLTFVSKYTGSDTTTTATSSLTTEEIAKNRIAMYLNMYDELAKNGYEVDDKVTNSEYLNTKLENGQYKVGGKLISENNSFESVNKDDIQAKAKQYYDTEMAKIHRKEKQMDIEQQKLQTEYSSLTNDLNSVKSILEANVQRSFTYCQQG